MSVHILTAVWKGSKSKGGSLLVLLAIADFADHHGRAFPSVATLGRKARMTPRNVQFALRELTKLGELEIERGTGPHGVNVYRVKCFQGEKFSGVKNEAARGETGFTRGVKPTSSNPSVLTVSKKPSKKNPPLTSPLGGPETVIVPSVLQKVVKKWNAISGVQEFQGDLATSPTLIRAFQRVAQKHPEPNFWGNLLQKIDGGCLFLKGYGPNGWRASLTWVLKLSNIDKVLAGNYD